MEDSKQNQGEQNRPWTLRLFEAALAAIPLGMVAVIILDAIKLFRIQPASLTKFKLYVVVLPGRGMLKSISPRVGRCFNLSGKIPRRLRRDSLFQSEH